MVYLDSVHDLQLFDIMFMTFFGVDGIEERVTHQKHNSSTSSKDEPLKSN